MAEISLPEGNYWLCPLYSVNCDSTSIDLTEGIYIRSTPSQFINYLDESYSHHLKTIPSSSKWTLIISNIVNIEDKETRVEVFSKIFEEHERVSNLLMDIITTFRLLEKGRLITGLLTSGKLLRKL